MMSDWLFSGAMPLLWVGFCTVALYALIIVFARWSGVRSFAEMSTFDIAVTIALGSLMASVVVSKNPPLAQGAVAVATLYALQLGVSRLRCRYRTVEAMADNAPILLMGPGGEIKHENLRVARVTEDDLRCHLRRVNVSDPRQVHAMIMEGTGNINVLHGDHHDRSDNPWIMQGVRDYEARPTFNTQRA
ncbi:hypothetical protein SADO_03885 [Salinisphaera dokdonensis CL-ES53]|uniref:YetF C-terminal domain-containing protein n=1 Tax=Salinisphaera dokdonensis CL-ES53 TaxID=1304272 RepID=A0ABV2AXJ3_9GAMM